MLRLKFARGRGLVGPDAPWLYISYIIVLAPDRAASHPPKHRDLTSVCKRVRQAALKEVAGIDVERLIGSKIIIERLNRSEEAADFLRPRKRSGVVPLLTAGD